jgi:biotin synthase-related radical SAM superfamily protein
MAKLTTLYEVKVDDTDAKRKIQNLINALEKVSEILKKNNNIEITVSVTPVYEKKWYQFWK